MLKNIARVAAVALIAGVALVACGSDQQACAAPMGNQLPMVAAPMGNQPPPPKGNTQRNQPKPGTQRTTSRVQDKPRTTINPAPKPTSWAGYNDRVKQRNWSQPYRKGYSVPQQPVIVNYYGHDYRTYPGYPGYYPIGVWPMHYGHDYGCVADQEADPETTAAPTANPTVTVTVSPSTTPSTSETPR